MFIATCASNARAQTAVSSDSASPPALSTAFSYSGEVVGDVAGGLMAGRVFFGISMLGFGALHFLYIPYVAFVIPNWIPAHVAFAYATGVAHVAAGLGILTGVIARVAAHAQDPNEWTSMLIALAMSGGALLVADALSRAPVAPAEVTAI